MPPPVVVGAGASSSRVIYKRGGGGGSDWTGTVLCGDEAAARAWKSKPEPCVGISEGQYLE